MDERVSIYCPFCHRYTSLDVAQVGDARRGIRVPAVWDRDPGHRWWIGICNGCGRPLLVLNAGQQVYPTPRPSPTSEYIPELIRSDLQEAKTCSAAACWRAAAVMARRAMQAAALERGAAKGHLGDQIAELAAAGKITIDLKEWADVVRWVGNDAAHPGGEEVTKEDAEEVLHLAEQFLHVLYVTPARALALRTKKGK